MVLLSTYALVSKRKTRSSTSDIIVKNFWPLTPEDAFRYFMATELDLLIVGNMILYKQEKNISLKENYKEKYKLN